MNNRIIFFYKFNYIYFISKFKPISIQIIIDLKSYKK